MSKSIILREDEHREEWWQPELHCEECGCTFMWSAYPDFSEYPKFCPNCGKEFTTLRKGKELIWQIFKGIADCQ